MMTAETRTDEAVIIDGAMLPPTTASDTVLPAKVSSPQFARTNTVPSPTQMVTPRTRNPRGLTLPSPTTPSTSTPTVQPNQFQSLGEGAANLAAQAPITPVRPVTPITPLLGHPSTVSPLPATSPSGKASTKGKLKSLLPRSHNEAHSYFHAKIEIEQLASVPFVRGEFGVRWKFKSSVSPGEIKGERHSPTTDETGGLLGKMKVRSMTGKGKGKEDSHGSGEFGMYQASSNYSNPHLASEGSRSTTLNSFSSYSSADSVPSRTASTATSNTGYTTVSTTTNGSSKTVAPNGNLSHNFFSSRTGEVSPSKLGVNQYLYSHSEDTEDSVLFSPNQPAFSTIPADPLSPGWEGAISPKVLSPTGTITPANLSNHPASFGALSPRNPAYVAPASTLSPSKGLVPYRPLKDHSITYSFPLNAIVKFDIARGGGSGPDGKPRPNLQGNEFKLVVIQRVIPDDPDGPPQNPRLGAIYLNLAEYVGKGRVERRYLLKESRVNATLKLSIELTYVSGNNEYVAPPLPKAEIMGGIENFLVQNENLNKQRTKDIYGYTYGPYRDKEELEVDLLGQTNVDLLEDDVPVDAGGLKPSASQDPYAIPSESESEMDDQGQASTTTTTSIDQSRRMFLKSLGRSATMSSEKRPQTKGTLTPKEAARLQKRQIRREERQRRFRLELEKNPYALPPSSGESATESEADEKEESEEEDGFESAPEEDGGKMDTASIQQTDESHSSAGHSSSQDHQRHYRPRGTNPDVSLASFATFDIQRLPLAYGPKTTEVLIDAIFNPALTTDKSKENPFTLYISPSDLARMKDDERRALIESHSGRDRLAGRATAPSMRSNGRSYSHATSNSTTTTSDSGRSADTDEQLEGLRSPDTIVAVPVRRQSPTGLGLAGVPLNRQRDATINGGPGKQQQQPGGVGGLLHSFQKHRKDKVHEGKKRGVPKRSDTTRSGSSSAASQSPISTNVLGSPVFVQEPTGMVDSEDAVVIGGKLRRSGDSNFSSMRANNSSSASLSSMSQGSRSGHGHGTPSVTVNGSGRATPGSRPLTRQSTTASNDVSVPDGRMDRTGFVKGGGASASPVPAHGIGSSFNRWWKGLGGAHGSSPGANHHKATPTAVAS